MVQPVRRTDANSGEVHLVIDGVQGANLLHHALAYQLAMRACCFDLLAQHGIERDLGDRTGDLLRLLRQ